MRVWTEMDDSIIRKFAARGSKIISDMLAATTGQVRHRAARIGVKITDRRKNPPPRARQGSSQRITNPRGAPLSAIHLADLSPRWDFVPYTPPKQWEPREGAFAYRTLPSGR